MSISRSSGADRYMWMKHMRSFAILCDAGIRKEQMAETYAQTCVSIPATPWSSRDSDFSAQFIKCPPLKTKHSRCNLIPYYCVMYCSLVMIS
ncbi:hypothetical protein ACSQ67_018569 [Phaseolus vulgaris]